MAYILYEYKFPNSYEIEIKYPGNYGAKGEKRAAKEKATPEQILKQNQWIRERNCRRLIKANFVLGDYWVTLLYPKGTRKGIKEVKTDIRKLYKLLGYRYKHWWKSPFKWVNRIEIGAQGGIHCHMIMNHIRGADVDMELQKLWNDITGGRAHFERFKGDEESAHKIADYLVKPLTENQQKKCEELGGDVKELSSYSHSRGNLEIPEPVKKVYKRRTLRKLLETGEPTPRPGYYVDKNSLVIGVNPFTGLSYCYYTEIRGDTEP